MDSVKKRLRYMVELLASGKHTVFAKRCGIPPGSFQAYIKGERIPPTEHLLKMNTVFGINLHWLLIGEGEPFGKKGAQEKILVIDPVLMLLNEEEERAGITLTPEHRTAILKVLRELVFRDVRSIRELLRLIPGTENQKMNES
jgi:hypothetical protein